MLFGPLTLPSLPSVYLRWDGNHLGANEIPSFVYSFIHALETHGAPKIVTHKTRALLSWRSQRSRGRQSINEDPRRQQSWEVLWWRQIRMVWRGVIGAYCCLGSKGRGYLRRSSLSLDLHRRDPALQTPGGREFQSKGRELVQRPVDRSRLGRWRKRHCAGS